MASKTISEYLTELGTDKETLVDTLNAKGVSADNTMGFTELVGLVDDISGGGINGVYLIQDPTDLDNLPNDPFNIALIRNYVPESTTSWNVNSPNSVQAHFLKIKKKFKIPQEVLQANSFLSTIDRPTGCLGVQSGQSCVYIRPNNIQFAGEWQPISGQLIIYIKYPYISSYSTFDVCIVYNHVYDPTSSSPNLGNFALDLNNSVGLLNYDDDYAIVDDSIIEPGSMYDIQAQNWMMISNGWDPGTGTPGVSTSYIFGNFYGFEPASLDRERIYVFNPFQNDWVLVFDSNNAQQEV